MKNTAFDFVGTVVEITAGNEKSVRFNKPVTITMQIPNDQKPTKEKVDDYLVDYWTGEHWEYIFPSIVDLNKGTVSYKTYLFSPYGTVKLTENQKVKLYTKKMALQTFEDEENEKNLVTRFKVYIMKLLKKWACHTVQCKESCSAQVQKNTILARCLFQQSEAIWRTLA